MAYTANRPNRRTGLTPFRRKMIKQDAARWAGEQGHPVTTEQAEALAGRCHVGIGEIWKIID